MFEHDPIIKVEELRDKSEVNEYLKNGWVLLKVGHIDSENYKGFEYSLGFTDPSNCYLTNGF